MTHRVLPLLLLAGSACSGERFDLLLRVPDRFEANLDELRLGVLDPPGAVPFDCDDLAFARINPAVVSASLDRQVILRSGETELGTFERTQPHLFVAEAFDAGGDRFAIGCTEASALDADTKLVLELEPVTFADTLEEPELYGVFGTDTLDPLTIEVTDVFDEPLTGIRAMWTTSAKGGVAIDAEANSGANGTFALAIPQLPSVSPLAIDLRVRWAEESPLRFSGFLRGAESIMPLGPGVVIDGAVAELDGAMTLVLLVERATEAALIFCTGALDCEEPRPLDLRERGRFVVIEDRLLLVTPSRFYTISGRTMMSYVARGAAGTEPLDVISAGACNGESRVLVRDENYDATLYRLDGTRAPEPAPLDGYEEQLFASGCVDTLDGQKIRTFVLGSEEEGTYIVALTGSEPSFAEWSAVGEGIAVGARGEGALLGAQLDLDAFVIARLSLEIFEEEIFLEPLDVDYTAAEAVRIAGAKLDADDHLDLIAILEDYDPETEENSYLLYAALDDAPAGERIAASLPLDLNLCLETLPTLWVADMDTDGDDDVLLLDHGQACGLNSRLVFIPM